MVDRKAEARPGSLEMIHDASVTWRYFAPVGVTLEMCRAPDYWRNVRRETGQQRVPGRHAFNRIEIMAEDGTWEAELRVMSVASNGDIETRLLREYRDAASQMAVPKGYVVDHVPGNGWRAMDHKGVVIAGKMTTRDEAVRAAQAHSRKAA